MGAVEAGAESQQAVDDEEEQEEAGLYPPQPGQNVFLPKYFIESNSFCFIQNGAPSIPSTVEEG